MVRNRSIKKVCHLTTVHSRYDNRIFHKECKSLANNGYDIILLVADGGKEEITEKVKIIGLKGTKKILRRLMIQPLTFFIQSIRQKADLYHFHDPELIFTGLLLKIAGKKVVYDIHEDYSTAFEHRKYLPGCTKALLSHIWQLLELIIAGFFSQIIAEKYYKARFKNAITILNYPIYLSTRTNAPNIDNYNMLYTGNIDEARGAYIHADLLNHNPKYRLTMIGHCDSNTYKVIQEICSGSIDKLCITVSQIYVPYTEIAKVYENNNWLCGLAIFPDSKHYREKELTKFYEYMMYGIPVLCSNFPAWRKIIEDTGAGITVNPGDPQMIIEKIEWLINNPKARYEMGIAGKNAIITKYNWAYEEKKLIELYRNIV